MLKVLVLVVGTRRTLPTSPQQFSSLPQLTRTTVPSSTSCTTPMSQSVTRKMFIVCQAHFPLRDFVLTRRPESPQARGLLHSSPGLTPVHSQPTLAWPGLIPVLGLFQPKANFKYNKANNWQTLIDSCIEFLFAQLSTFKMGLRDHVGPELE